MNKEVTKIILQTIGAIVGAIIIFGSLLPWLIKADNTIIHAFTMGIAATGFIYYLYMIIKDMKK